MHADNPKKNFAIFSLVDVLDIDIKILRYYFKKF